MSSPPFHVVTCVWGEEYTKVFVDLALPAMLAPGNLPALADGPRNLYHIVTTDADQATIENSAAFPRLAELVKVQFDRIDAPSSDTPRHDIQSYSNRLGIATADAAGAAIIFLNPDVIVADGGVRSLRRMIAAGKRAINVLGIRMIRERAVPRLMKHHRSGAGDVLTISPRQLIGLAMDALHPLTMMQVHNARDYDWLPSAILWPVGRQGMVARCFHLHPMCVYPRVKNARFSTTIDDDYLRAACPDPEDEYVVLESDEFCAVEMSGLDRIGRSQPRPDNDGAFVDWALIGAKPHHLELFCHRIFLRGEQTDQAAWSAVSRASDETVARIVNGIAMKRIAQAMPQIGPAMLG